MSMNGAAATLLEKLKRLIPQGQFARHVAMLTGGTAFGQAIVVLASPIITRLYTPEDMGILATFASLLGIMMVIVALRYELAIPLPEDDTTAANLLWLCFAIILGMVTLITLVLFLQGNKIGIWISAPQVTPYLWLLPVGLLATGTYHTFTYWAIRKQAFQRIAQTKLTQSIGQVVTQVGMGVFQGGTVGLLLGDVVGHGGGSGNLMRQAWQQDKTALLSATPAGMYRVARRYWKFPAISSGASLLNVAGVQLPPLLLIAFYEPSIVGWFGLAWKVIAMPMTLIGQSVAQVFFARASQLFHEQPATLQDEFFKTTARLLLLSLGIVPIALTSPWAFTLIFGEAWRESGFYVQSLAFMFMAQLIVSPVTQLLIVFELQAWQFGWDLARLGGTIGSFWIGHSQGWPAITTITLYSITMSMLYLIHFLLNVYALKTNVHTRNGSS